MSALDHTLPNPPRFVVAVSEFTVSSRVRGRDAEGLLAEFTLFGHVRPADDDADPDIRSHPLEGRMLTVAFVGAKPTEGGRLGAIQFAPAAPDIPAVARIVGCPRRIAALRATAHHAAGPLGGNMELVLEVGSAVEPDGGPVWRIPVRDAMLRATRRFDAPADALRVDVAVLDETPEPFGAER